ncbi:MAG: Bro-N domain-containing protein, partial [Oscillospiraceae bacterium]|nr:Bro-N domain-containing protein [Oscillospiraceae bacterium]
MLDCESCHLKRLNTKLNVFMHEEFGEVRTVEIDGQVYFVGLDVAKALGYKNTRKAIKDNVDKDDVTPGYPITDSLGRIQRVNIINESGLYSLILASKLEKAKKFKHWVTSEVLPAIRKTGSYNPNPPQIETTQPIQQIEVHIDHVENLHITQKKEVFLM